MTCNTRLQLMAVCCFLVAAITSLAADESAAPPVNAEELALRQQTLADAGTSLEQAAKAVDEARLALAASGTSEPQDFNLTREELSRAHQLLRDASREVARAHRSLSGGTQQEKVIRIVVGDQAVIGVALGNESEAGIELVGVSPDGPAERAGMRPGDVVTSIGAVSLAGHGDGTARDALLAFMDGAKPGVALPVEVLRDGNVVALSVVPEQREPSSWQSLIRLPAQPPMPPMEPGLEPLNSRPGAPMHDLTPEQAPLDAVAFDEEDLAARVQKITENAQQFEYMFTGEDGKTVQFTKTISVDGAPLSELGEHALANSDIWFDLPQTRGLELTSLNPALGKYFKAEKGVLVIEASQDNTYGLESGDVITAVGATEVSSPGDLLRAMRDATPGGEIELAIKRDRKNRTLKATVPENRLGLLEFRTQEERRLVVPPPPPNR